MFYIQDEPPNWPDGSDDDLGLESVSEPDLDIDDFLEDELDGQDKEEHDKKSRDGDNDSGDESDFEAVTPGPRTKPTFADIVPGQNHDPSPRPDEESDEGSEEWINPTPPPPSGFSAMQHRVATPDSSRHSSPTPGTSSPSPPPHDPIHRRHYPFPAAPGGENDYQERKKPMLRSVRAKNGGRTKSGGIKGVPWPGDVEGEGS